MLHYLLPSAPKFWLSLQSNMTLNPAPQRSIFNDWNKISNYFFIYIVTFYIIIYIFQYTCFLAVGLLPYTVSVISSQAIKCARVLSHFWLFETWWPQPTRLLCPWGYPGKNPGVGCHFLLQGIFPTQGYNPSLLPLLQCRQILHHWKSHRRNIT